ncbi:MAG: hypothetical protein SFV51_23200 [Bryobacteraceae bacterium]|nr:hypothetical protein [Bryobacteraceae bacterium]
MPRLIIQKGLPRTSRDERLANSLVALLTGVLLCSVSYGLVSVLWMSPL